MAKGTESLVTLLTRMQSSMATLAMVVRLNCTVLLTR